MPGLCHEPCQRVPGAGSCGFPGAPEPCSGLWCVPWGRHPQHVPYAPMLWGPALSLARHRCTRVSRTDTKAMGRTRSGRKKREIPALHLSRQSLHLSQPAPWGVTSSGVVNSSHRIARALCVSPPCRLPYPFDLVVPKVAPRAATPASSVTIGTAAGLPPCPRPPRPRCRGCAVPACEVWRMEAPRCRRARRRFGLRCRAQSRGYRCHGTCGV